MLNTYVDPWDKLNNSCFHVEAEIDCCHAAACHMPHAYVDPWDMLNNFCFYVHAKNYCFSYCHMPYVTCHVSNSYVDPGDMLNNFCFHVSAEKWLFVMLPHVAIQMSRESTKHRIGPGIRAKLVKFHDDHA